MAVYDGNRMAQDSLLEVAGLCAVAALKAPQATRKVQIKTAVVTGDDLQPIIEILGILGEASAFIRGDHVTLKKTCESGTPPVVLLVGADLTYSELNWNCGACGFDTCAEFNRYSKENRGAGALWQGPSCVWKTLDYGMAVDWACAAAWQYNVDNRAQGSVGAAAALLGHLAGCSAITGLSLGPCADQVWYNRPTLKHEFTQEDIAQAMFRTMPQHFLGFAGGGNPMFKTSGNWFGDLKFALPVQAPEAADLMAGIFERLTAVVQREAAKKEGCCSGAGEKSCK